MAERQRPACALSLGTLRATIWANKRENGNSNIFYSVQINRSYRDSQDEWQQTTYFNHSDLLNVARLAERAEEWIAQQRVKTVRDNVEVVEDDVDVPF